MTDIGPECHIEISTEEDLDQEVEEEGSIQEVEALTEALAELQIEVQTEALTGTQTEVPVEEEVLTEAQMSEGPDPPPDLSTKIKIDALGADNLATLPETVKTHKHHKKAIIVYRTI